MSSLFGWDLLYSSVKDDINSNEDILVCLTHLVLVSNGFKCIGIGESKVIDGSETKSEALPKGWNDDYTLRYVLQGRLYNLKGTIIDDTIMINLFRVDERTVSMIQLDRSAVQQRNGNLDEMIPDQENLVDLIKKQLIENVTVSKRSRESSSQTEPAAPQHPPYFVESVDPVRSILVDGRRPPNYGRADLDPFNGMDPLRGPPGLIRPNGGGGMLFQPPPGLPYLPPGTPPGAIPPGARYDPFRPPNVGFPPRRDPNRPDNDEFPPPGYDDMFM
ncbi:proteasome inhibitor PI31 subunit [Aethina tumida]|uniref:proteasome inhibitor PI31 subunit n=1 Tax=Aethina tumida TaxID=116153 RepID=UPI0021491F1F|nr:proteasome inhibitor PI31 subunit [Aethina tumida]